ncbi:restriction endonuclease subunit S [Mammaliicoccus sp. M-M49]|uniref:restriction endonuclease subunit S n=1 Tax=Mammaliicoccus sp. M-M49 TaxID=2898708 RepID=UPI001EFB1E2A|nr:restriction endonuclease subunit S [Mammaliicoccus sp. M-M49]
MEFKEYKLSDLTINGKGEYGIGASAVEYNPSLYRYLRITDIDDNGFINTDELKSVNDKNAENYLLKENEIVFARTGNSTGKSYFYNGEDGPLVFAGFLIRFKLDSKKVNPKFIRYYTLSENYKGWINQFATGSTRKNINAKTYGNMIIKLPPRSYQNYIVQILDSLEEKLKENKKIIANLEELSQTLFKRWFVDFEFPDENGNPYKSSGGEMIDSEMGLIPRGWEVKSADEIYEITIGKTPPRKLTELFSEKEGIDWVSISDMKSEGMFIKSTKEKIIEEGVVDYKVKIVPKDSVLLSFKLTIGRVKLTNKELTTNEAIAHFYSSNINKLYTYLYLKNFEYGYLGNTSSIATAVNSKIIKKMPILAPEQKVLKRFINIAEPFMNRINIIQNENIELNQLRDTLLPKLMSGEIELPDDIEVNEDELSI